MCAGLSQARELVEERTLFVAELGGPLDEWEGRPLPELVDASIRDIATPLIHRALGGRGRSAWVPVRLEARPGAVVMITHDRSFLNQVATRIVDLDRGKLLSFLLPFARGILVPSVNLNLLKIESLPVKKRSLTPNTDKSLPF